MQENGMGDIRRARRLRCAGVFALLAFALGMIAVLNVGIGSVSIPASQIVDVLFGSKENATQAAIILRIRMPRMALAAILGGALSLAGFLLQTFFSNPIAGPFVLGISSGAKMAVAMTMIVFLGSTGAVSSWTLVGAAFAGSLLCVGFILVLSRRLRHMASLLVGGIMIGYICSAVTDFVITFAEDADIVNLHGWSQGSFSAASWESVAVAAVLVGVTSALVFLLAKPIGAYQLGEAYAQSMGVNIRVFRVLLIALSSLLSACVTAFAGPISFVGIAVPHLIKRAMGTSKPLAVIPAIFLGGAVFCMGCDLIARTAFAPTELNISTVTSVFGAPVVIAMLAKRQAQR